MVPKLIYLAVNCALLVNFANGYANLQWDPSQPAFDPNIYENALDPELCQKQLEYIKEDVPLRLQFIDAGPRIPRGIFTMNFLDMGNYFQCLEINRELDDSTIQGKYCMIQGPFNRNLEYLAEHQHLLDIDVEKVILSNDTLKYLAVSEDKKIGFKALSGVTDGARIPGTIFEDTLLSFGICIPKSCTSQEGINGLLIDLSTMGLEFTEEYCRLPDDKPWVPVDYVAITLLSFIGLLTILSTSYDLYYNFISKNDVKPNQLYTMFSVYTNGRRLTKYTPTPNALECVDGVRALAMAWVLVGHTFTSMPVWANPVDTFVFSAEFSSLWITGAHLTVDTFFFLSGLLVVYTTAGKLTGMKLLKNIHLFYLNRLLRMFPILAVGVLMEASIAHRISDGPNWQAVATHANRCRSMWWTTLLHVQNYVSPRNVCIGQTWYLAIDVQCHILSPLILFWVLGRKPKIAWIALIGGLLACLTGATVYNFIMEFPSSMMTPARRHEMMHYMQYYYMNTLTRAAPFFVGMIFGYILYTWKGKNIPLPTFTTGSFWFCAVVLSSAAMYLTYPALQVEWDNQLMDTLINSFQRPMWAIALGWLIVACAHGYAGPINWFLSLRMWKLPARLSYAMYILHWSIMTVVNGSRVAPAYFSVSYVLNLFLSHTALSFIAAFIFTLLVDAPCSTFFKMILGGGGRKKTQSSGVQTTPLGNGITMVNGKNTVSDEHKKE